MKQDMRMAFLAVGNFEGNNLGYLYHCMAPDYSFKYFSIDVVSSAADITQNPCF